MSRILTDSYERELQHRHEQHHRTGTSRSFRRWISHIGTLVRTRRQPRGT